MLSTARKRVEDDNNDERIYKAAGLPEPHESSRTVIVGLDKNVRNECISWNKEKSIMTALLLIFIMMFTFQEIGRNSGDAWYSSTYISLAEAISNECIRTEAQIAIRPVRNEKYWSNSIRTLAEQAEETAFKMRTEAEYRMVVDAISNCTAPEPCNVLVFGVGWDAFLLIDANFHGRTVFLEDDRKWQQMVRKRIPCMQSFLVTYSTRLRDWPMYVAPKNKEQLDMVLPLVVARTAWDVIIVRGPSGDATKLGAWNSPGRMQSLYTASRLARLYFRHPERRKHVDVVVYDSERMVEKKFSSLFLGDDNIVEKAGSLTRFRLEKDFDLSLPIPENNV